MDYSSPRLARAYAFDRPPVHALVLASAAVPSVDRALDLGCGAGLSAQALLPYARHVIGLEPSLAMLAHRRPGVSYVAGSMEQLPFHSGSFDLVSAGGSLNYAVLPDALASISRVLAPGGRFLLWDFGFAPTGALAPWWEEFVSRYPFPSGYEMDRLSSLTYVDVHVSLPMDLESFVRYMLSEVDVDSEEALASVRSWCMATLTPVFAGPSLLDIHFDGYVAM